MRKSTFLNESSSGFPKVLILVLFLICITTTLQSQNIVAMEYFIDDDPGFGNGTAIPVTAGPTISESFTIPTNTLSNGIHFLHIRALDDNGIWSFTEKRGFAVVPVVALPPVPVIDAMEYFIDVDPGPGNATAFSITPGNTVNLNTNIDVSSLSPGLHFLFIRTRYDNGNWGVAEKRPFRINAPEAALQQRIVKIEYYFDTDPGIGNGSQINVAPVDILSLDTTLNTSALSQGPHDLGIRVQDETGAWSPTELSAISVCDGPNPLFSIDLNCSGLVTNFTDNSTDLAAGDIYRWDFDGDNTFDDFTAGNTSFTYSAAGTYNVHLQIEPLSGCISNYYQQIEVFDVPSADFQAISGCVGDPIDFTDLSIATGSPTYEWDFDGDAIVDDNTVGSTQAVYNTPGVYDATLTVTTGLGCTSQQIVSITIDAIPPDPIVTDGGGKIGQQVTLQAEGASNGLYRWYINSTDQNPIPGETGGTYITPALTNPTRYFVSIVSANELCESNRIRVNANIENVRLEVYNVVTPRENGKHDFLKIGNIEFFPENTVTIYNRWGDKVFDIENYNNSDRIFIGLDNSGNELPDGNYYYVIDRNEGSAVNGYLLLRR